MYFLQFALLYSLFYLAYRFGLSKTGRLSANRWYLLGSYVVALLLPVLPFPPLFELSTNSTTAASALTTVVTEVSNGVTPMLRGGEAHLPQAVSASPKPVDWPLVLTLVYGLGVLVFLLRYLLQLLALRRMTALAYLVNDQRWSGKVSLYGINEQENIAFTFGHCFYVSSKLLASPDADLILAHEHAHARQWHTVDMTVAELFTALLWWHPLAWLHRHDLRLNLEFLADRAVLDAGHPTKNYQLSLLRFCESLAARPALSFTQSPLKTRIVMMKMKKRSTSVYFLIMLMVVMLSSLITACNTEPITTNVTADSNTPFEKIFTGTEGWQEARTLLQNNYANHQVAYFVNGQPAQNEIIPKPEDIKTVVLAANTQQPGKTAVAFTTLQNNWVSAMGWHASEERQRIEADTYANWTEDLLLAGGEPTDLYTITFYGTSGVIEGAMDYTATEYPNAAVTFFRDGVPMEIADVLKTPEEVIKAIVVSHTYTVKERAIVHFITSL